MTKMTSKQIDRLNELLINDSRTLTAFYDEGIDIGFIKGLKSGIIVGIVGVAIGSVVTLSVQGIRHLRKKSKES